nr:unnamed protein product [Spirometra erinaceieuropaei]
MDICSFIYSLKVQFSGVTNNLAWRYRTIVDAHKALCLGLSNLVEELERNSFQYLQEPESDMQEAVNHAIRLINPRAIIIAAPHGRIKDVGRFSSLLDDDVFDDPKLQRQRLLTFPQLYPDCGVFRLLDVQVSFTRTLDRKRWNAALNELRSNLSAILCGGSSFLKGLPTEG